MVMFNILIGLRPFKMKPKIKNHCYSNNPESSPHIQSRRLCFITQESDTMGKNYRKLQFRGKEKRVGKGEHNHFLIGKELDTSWKGEEKTISRGDHSN